MPLDDDTVSELLDAFQKAGDAYAVAKARAVVMGENRKIVLAQLIRAAEADLQIKTLPSRDAWARTHPKFRQAVDLLGEAVEQEHRADTRKEYTRMEYEAWRSLNANRRV